jgi:CheY-like chemotaxis protein
VVVTARVSKILIVDDTPHNIDVLSATLSDEHCELMAATSGARALELAARGRPDLVLLDVMMPGMDGFEVCRRLKADPATADIPVVVVSADASPGLIERLFAAGALACLSKPLDLNEFGAILDSLPAPTDIGPVPFVPPQGKPPTASEIDKYLA